MKFSVQHGMRVFYIPTFILELPFWLGFLYCSLLPATITPCWEIESIPISLKDIVIIVVTGFYLLLQSINNYPIATSHKSWHYHLPILTVSLLLYAALSVAWSGMDIRNAMAMLSTLILTASGFLLAYNLIAKRSFESIRPFLWRVTVYLAALGLLYSAASFFSLGLGEVRSTFNSVKYDFGIPRVAGPLFISSTGYFILGPALAFSMQELIQSPTRRLFKLSIVFSLMLTIIGLGSRGGLIVIGTFFFLLILFMKNKKQAIAAVLVMIIAITAAAGLFFSKAKTDRLQSFEDTARSDTYMTSFKILINRTAEFNIPGSGYGSYWPWYLPSVEDGGVFGTDQFFIHTRFGTMLFNPHSTFLILIVELGAVGLLFFLFLGSVLTRLLLRNSQRSSSSIFSCGVFASGFSMFLDCFIFTYAPLNTLWWIFLFGSLALNSDINICRSPNPSRTYN